MKSKTEKVKKDTRPVRCFICKKKMYYLEHPKFEPEFKICDSNYHSEGYIHQKCVKKIQETKKEKEMLEKIKEILNNDECDSEHKLLLIRHRLEGD